MYQLEDLLSFLHSAIKSWITDHIVPFLWKPGNSEPNLWLDQSTVLARPTRRNFTFQGTSLRRNCHYQKADLCYPPGHGLLLAFSSSNLWVIVQLTVSTWGSRNLSHTSIILTSCHHRYKLFLLTHLPWFEKQSHDLFFYINFISKLIHLLWQTTSHSFCKIYKISINK